VKQSKITWDIKIQAICRIIKRCYWCSSPMLIRK